MPDEEEDDAPAVEPSGLTAAQIVEMPLVPFVHAVSPQFAPPTHLHEWTDLIERGFRERIRGMVAVPIRHHKTWTTLHGIAWLLVRNPKLRIIGMCADHDRAQELGKMCRRLCDSVATQTGVPIGPTRGDNIILDWKNKFTGGVVWMSAKQSALGKDVDILIVDDPLSELDANDAAIRDAVDHAIAHYTMRATGSVLLVMSRWHPDDPVGRRMNRSEVTWEYIHHRAIETDANGVESAFAPAVMPLAEIKRRRREASEADPGELLWYAQWQNEPRAALDSKVRQPMRYTEVPTWPGFRYAMGVDLAYKAGERSDYFALVVVKFYQLRGFIVEVVREKPDFHMMLHALQQRWERYGRCPIFSYIAGPEIGAIRYFTDKGVPIQGLPARWSKAYRAQNTIQRWNDGNLLVPERAPWVNGFVARAMMFTGNEKDRDDDEWDALVSVCDAILGSSAAFAPYGVGQRRLPRQELVPKDDKD